MKELREVLLKGCREAGLKLSEQQLEGFSKYSELLIEWNQKVNLTAIKDIEGIAIKHFIDSLLCSKHLSAGKTLIDIGTGAGFPGLPLKIYLEPLDVTLVDSLNKRVNFLDEVIKQLDLRGINTIHGRAEDLAVQATHREAYEIVVSRAVAKLSVLAEYCLPFVKSGGILLAMKGSNITEEVEEAKYAIQELGGRLKEVVEYQLPILGDGRSLIIVEKHAHTPDKYPRKAGLPEKKPLVKKQ